MAAPLDATPDCREACAKQDVYDRHHANHTHCFDCGTIIWFTDYDERGALSEHGVRECGDDWFCHPCYAKPMPGAA